MTRSGIVTVVGKPNAGKSTLLNRIVGVKLSITSAKPQSTRDRIVGIHSTDDTQMVILDTPGLLQPRYALHESMRATALRALEDADVIVYLLDATEHTRPPLVEAAQLQAPPSARVLTVLNKIDALDQETRRELAAGEDPDTLAVSAVSGEGVEALVTRIRETLPHSPFLYPADDVSTQSVRFFAAELIRETALEQLDEEVPYGVACQVEEFREERTPLYIRATVFVECDSQKKILIGERGSKIRDIGRAARLKIETLVEQPVYLDLWVKVLPNWRKNKHSLQRLGYRLPEGHSS